MVVAYSIDFVDLISGQDTVVLRKNGRHSLGRTQDRIPVPTSKRKREREQNSERKSIEFVNRKRRALNERAQKIDSEALKIEKDPLERRTLNCVVDSDFKYLVKYL